MRQRLMSYSGLPLLVLTARVLKFHMHIPHEEIFDRYFFMSELCPFTELCPSENEILKYFVQDISKSV